jgi:hypothetical protein
MGHKAPARAAGNNRHLLLQSRQKINRKNQGKHSLLKTGLHLNSDSRFLFIFPNVTKAGS